MKRNFESWFLTMKGNTLTWNYYTDFSRVYDNVNRLKIEFNILNSLIGSKNIEEEFKSLLTKYPGTIKTIPFLLAKREKEIRTVDPNEACVFNFEKANYSIDQYTLFMKNSGLFELLQNHVINNLINYVLGAKVGMDTNERKNKTGNGMKDLVESYLIKAGLVKEKTYFKEMKKSDVEKKFGLDLSKISNQENAEKRFDFVIKDPLGGIYACECNFYHGGYKLNETARNYKKIAIEAKGISKFTFVWFTDGLGWSSARENLEEIFDILDTVYNIKDLEDGIVEKMLDIDLAINEMAEKCN